MNTWNWNQTIAILVIILVLTGIAYVLATAAAKHTGAPQKPEQVACTMDAKLCPDGSYVGRQGPNCEFAACPGTASTSVQIEL